MASYRIEVKKSADKSLAKPPASTKQNIAQLIDKLAENTYWEGSKKLVGSEHTYRIRSGRLPNYLRCFRCLVSYQYCKSQPP